MMDDIERAYQTYLARQERREHPEGRRDKAGRWYPSAAEEQDCCRAVRSPSRAYPWSLMLHCRSAEHVARLCGVEPAALKARIAEGRRAEMAAAKREREARDYWKLVARVGGRLLSVYDGETEYRLGETLTQRARQGHGGGYYVYATREEALRAVFPRDAALRGAEKVLLRCRCAGSHVEYDNGKHSFGRVTPVEVVEVAAAREVA